MNGADHALTALVTACAPSATAAGGWDLVGLVPERIRLAGAGLLRLERAVLPHGPEAAGTRATALVKDLHPDVVLHLATGTQAAGLHLVATARPEGGDPLEATWPAGPLAGRLRAHGAAAEAVDGAHPLSAAVLGACLAACREQGLDGTLTGLLLLPATAAPATAREQGALARLLVELIDQVRRHRAWCEGHGRIRVPRPVRTLRVGLTGGIGSGKSTVARLLAQRGAHVVDADALAREALAPGSTGLERLRAIFGDAVLDADGAVNRPALAARVFDDPRARAALESITLPWIAQTAAERLEAAGPGHVGVYDVPLLTEAGMADLFDLVVVVETPMAQRLARLERRGLPPAQAEARVRAQATDAQRRALADVVLVNDGTVEDLADGVAWLWEHRVLPALA
ncbi:MULTISPECIES: dephospho-CoA kinase [unclassified Actinomyces]|uniref:dephospho-CoA kinase n=1 Tax=unclassified Actinomyces TaxID=2609248 RepID=UPI0020174E42|nr:MULTISPECIES: dephospho-CoA kinase [unclassified Actinomyces]MCL3777505.1 dephospho-CoA kinase [Actinomyces sp. AC-20-1]MCL3790095.1 dephospho-CoA kinase [Actinomyces sp. 187325]MCL3792380.1 dephospho-CoA kinase [Actinomyces sp. 186855]MCL3794114.1 dephospho-CoA kinase [Actinomyces sp. 217892]